MKNTSKKTSRRAFMNSVIKTSAVVPFIGAQSLSAAASRVNIKPDSPLKILILGGTSFLGPHQIAYALGRGHSVSIFSRGKTQPTIHKDLFLRVEHLLGDREDNLEALRGRSWDVVIDNSGRKVEWTKATAELLRESCDLYIYVSSVSVFYPYYKAGLKEEDPLVLKVPETMEDDDEKMTYDYGVMKANSENIAMEIFGKERSTIVRPTFMTGPSDRTNRFMYWPTRLAEGGDIIIPGSDNDPVQYIDVRDIAGWMIRLAENKTTGIFNGVGPASITSLPAFVHGCHAAFSSKVNYIHMNDPKFLEENNLTFVAPWIKDMKKYHGISRVNNQKAIDSGLSFTPLAVTVKDTYDWWYSDAVSEERRNKFLLEEFSLISREKELLEKWNTWHK